MSYSKFCFLINNVILNASISIYRYLKSCFTKIFSTILKTMRFTCVYIYIYTHVNVPIYNFAAVSTYLVFIKFKYWIPSKIWILNTCILLLVTQRPR